VHQAPPIVDQVAVGLALELEGGHGTNAPNPRLLIFSTSGTLIAALPCVICGPPTLTFSWDGSGVASGLYYAAVDLGDGVVRGQFPLMVLP
jgi:hypothetical protein